MLSMTYDISYFHTSYIDDILIILNIDEIIMYSIS